MKNLFTVAALLVAGVAHAQWLPNPYTSGNIRFDGGNVGIGTGSTAPAAKLELVGDGSLLRFRGAGYSANTPLEIVNDGPAGSGLSGAFNFSLRVGYPHGQGVGAGEKLDMIKTVNGGTILGTSSSGASLGNIGIGTTAPVAKVEIVDNDVFLRLRGTGYSANTPFEIKYLGGTNSGAMNFAMRIGYHHPTGVNAGKKLDLLKLQDGAIVLGTDVDGAALGKVGIGTVSPDAPLTVKGRVHAAEVVVDMAANVAPDYVFESDYKLPRLSAVRSYIREHKHLPEIPSACEMEENGVNLNDMNMLLLKKVEELTLYMLDANEKIEALQAEVQALKKGGRE